jgi:hypothetical protein
MSTPLAKPSIDGQFHTHRLMLTCIDSFPIIPCNPLIEAWCEPSDFPNAMAGLATGHRAGFWVVDIDKKSDGYKSLAALEARYGKLPDSMRVRTAGGGMHIYFKMPPGVFIPQRAGDIADGIDVRGSTGYVIAPDSVTSDGRVYELIGDRSFGDIELAPLWLLFLAVFGETRRERLAKVGINGPDDLRCEPWQWEDRVRELLRLERPRLQGMMTEGRHGETRNYIEKGALKEIEAIRWLKETTRNTGVNTSAIKVLSLLKGAAELGVDVNDLEDRLFAHFSDTVYGIGSTGEEFCKPEWIEWKWEQARADADPRDLGHVGKPDAADEFPDLKSSRAILRERTWPNAGPALLSGT